MLQLTSIPRCIVLDKDGLLMKDDYQFSWKDGVVQTGQLEDDIRNWIRVK